MRLNDLRDNPGAARKQKRIGRGPGSGKGKTGGRGIKGQKARAGVAVRAFEGGQMPLYRRLPKRGFTKPNRAEYVVLNLGQLQAWIDAGRLDASRPIDEDGLVASGITSRKRDGIRLLAKGVLKARIAITVTGASRPAVAAVEALGGTITVLAAPAAATE